MTRKRAVGRDYGDLEPLLPPRLLPAGCFFLFSFSLYHNEDSPSVQPHTRSTWHALKPARIIPLCPCRCGAGSNQPVLYACMST